MINKMSLSDIDGEFSFVSSPKVFNELKNISINNGLVAIESNEYDVLK